MQQSDTRFEASEIVDRLADLREANLAIFDGIVEQALQYGLIGGEVLYTDSTHLKANANKNRFEAHRVEQKPAVYLAELEAAIDADRKEHGKAPLPVARHLSRPARSKSAVPIQTRAS